MIALLSDVHANLEALQAVWADLTARGVKRIVFLGDIIGYGPDPVEVLTFLKRFEFSLLGNHDRAVARHSDIELQRGDPQLERASEGRQRILGQQPTGAAVSLRVEVLPRLAARRNGAGTSQPREEQQRPARQVGPHLGVV